MRDVYVTPAGEVLASRSVSDGHDGARLHVSPAGKERDWAIALRDGKPPAGDGVALSAEGMQHVREHSEAVAHLLEAATLRGFIRYWTFAIEGARPRVLGDVLWPAQEQFLAAAEQHPFIYALKARQLGESTAACAFDGFVARFGSPNAAVSLFSKRDQEAVDLLEQVRFGYDRLPEWLRLPISRSTTHALELSAGAGDTRVVRAFSTTESAARGSTATHAHVDELAAMLNPSRTWQAIEPSIATGGTCHLLATGGGPNNYASDLWRKTVAGQSRFHGLFIAATERPGRNSAWLDATKRSMDPARFAQEYPLRWEDALSGSGEFVFPSADIDAAAKDYYPLRDPIPGHKYVTGVDVGQRDATVIVTLDVTGRVYDVANFVYVREASYPRIVAEIERVYQKYRGTVAVAARALCVATTRSYADLDGEHRAGLEPRTRWAHRRR